MKKIASPENAACVLSGILVGTSYIPFVPWALLFCYAPLFYAWIKDPRPRLVFWRGWVAQVVMTMIGFHWIAHTSTEYGHLPWIVSLFVLFAFAAAMHLHIPVGGLVWSWIHRKLHPPLWLSLLILAVAMVAVETSAPMIFPWHMGYTWLAAHLPGSNWADVIGFQGLSLLTLLFSAAFAGLWAAPRSVATKVGGAALLLAVFALVNISGAFHGMSQRERYMNDAKEIQALVVQANIGNYEKYLAERVADIRLPIIKTYERLTRDAALAHPEAQVVIWPETAFPDALDQEFGEHLYQRQVRDLIRSIHKPFLLGAYSEDRRLGRVYNGLFNYDENGNYKNIYRKMKLLAFGEYFPLAEKFPILKKLVPAISDFGFGDEPHLLPVTVSGVEVRFGAQICYEGLFPTMSAELTKRGADIFLNVTNDSWFGNTFEPRQHRIMTLARAIEFRRPLIRSTNTGITSAILADGTELTQSPQNSEWFFNYAVKYKPDAPQTVFTQLSPFLEFIFWVLLALLATGAAFYGRTQKS